MLLTLRCSIYPYISIGKFLNILSLPPLSPSPPPIDSVHVIKDYSFDTLYDISNRDDEIPRLLRRLNIDSIIVRPSIIGSPLVIGIFISIDYPSPS